MNTVNNKRRQASREKIKSVFIELLQTHELDRITVSDICKRSGLNRSTFYANYTDIYDLADRLRDELEQEVARLYAAEEQGKYYADNWLRLFYHIRNNPLFYKTYFKLGYDHEHGVNISELTADYPIFPEETMEYHVEFFKAGFNAIVKKWMDGGCRETPEQMSEILKAEYQGRGDTI